MKQPRTLLAVFPSGTTMYSYFIPEGDEPKVGDFIVTSAGMHSESATVCNPTSMKTSAILSNFKMATVVDLEITPNEKARKFYLQLVPVQQVKDRRQQSEEMAKFLRDRVEAQKRLEQLLSERDKTDAYRRLAATSPEAAELVKLLGLA